jgi:protein O-mannosyl-transferase
VKSLDRTAETDCRERLQFTLWSTLLCVLVGIAYWPVQSFDFVNWDDTWYVLRNPYLGSWELANLKAIATDVINRNYAPLTIFTYLVEHTFFGLEPAGYHIFNVLLHAVNAVLVFTLISQVTKNRAAGWMTAAIFAVHPVQIESVAWVSSMKGLLCGTFILAHLICRLSPERTPRQDVWGFVFFLLALFSKALTVVVPAIVLLYDMLVCKRKFKEALIGQFATGMLSVWLLVTTMSAQGTTLGGIRSHLALSKLEILGVDSIILWRYVGMLLWPDGLSVLYNPPVSGIAGQVIFGTLAWSVFGSIVWKLRRVSPLLVLAAATWMILLLPVLNLTPLTTLMNDRYLYMPAIPFFAAVSCGLCFLWKELLVAGQVLRKQSSSQSEGRVRHAWLTIPIGAIFALLIATRQHLPVWANDRALWEHTMTRVPELPIVRIQYAMMLHQAGEDGSAISILEETLTRYKPDSIDRERITTKIAAWHRQDSEAGGTREWVIRESMVRPELPHAGR